MSLTGEQAVKKNNFFFKLKMNTEENQLKGNT